MHYELERLECTLPSDSTFREDSISLKKEDEENFKNNKETGVVDWFDRTKGFGRIRRKNGERVFVHKSNIESVITTSDKVVFVMGKGQKGPTAKMVKKLT